MGAQLLGAAQGMRDAYRVKWAPDAYMREFTEEIWRELGDEADIAYEAGRHLGTGHALRLAAELGATW